MEHEYIEWLKNETESSSQKHPNLIMGIGDDAAIVDFKNGDTVISTDMLADGVHFIVGQTPLALIGRKAMAVNLSDLAAMAARPVCAVVSLMLPRSFSINEAKELTVGMLEIASEFGVAIAGGDTNRWDGPLVINVTITGLLECEAHYCNTWEMNDALAGDRILVSGEFGHSIKQKHFSFTPKVALALWLKDRYTVHAATDITDSLTADLAKVAKQSGVGMIIDADAVPISQDASEEHGLGSQAALNAALHDGEDFELAITVDPETAKRILEDPQRPCKMTDIGEITEERQLLLKQAGQSAQPLNVQGYQH